ncbi:hypothetical protein JST97_09710 [bacterium]|nr:hypothetical protein [bacterium]
MRRLLSLLISLVVPGLLYAVPLSEPADWWWALQFYLGFLCARCGSRGLGVARTAQRDNARRSLLPALGLSWLEMALVVPWLLAHRSAEEGTAWAGFLGGLACFYTSLGAWAGLRQEGYRAAQTVYGWLILWGAASLLAPMLTRELGPSLWFSPWAFAGRNWGALAAHWTAGLLLYLLIPERPRRLEQEEAPTAHGLWSWSLLLYLALVGAPVFLEGQQFFKILPLSLSAHLTFWCVLASQRGVTSNACEKVWGTLLKSLAGRSLRQCWMLSPLLLLEMSLLTPNADYLSHWATLMLISSCSIIAWTSWSLALSLRFVERPSLAALISGCTLAVVVLSGLLLGGERSLLMEVSPLFTGFALGTHYSSGQSGVLVPLVFDVGLGSLSWGLGSRYGQKTPFWGED